MVNNMYLTFSDSKVRSEADLGVEGGTTCSTDKVSSGEGAVSPAAGGAASVHEGVGVVEEGKVVTV